jgi:hypothetical protein
MGLRTAGVVGQGGGRAGRGRVRLLGIPVDIFCATEGYAEKALRELALQVRWGSDNQGSGAERALGRAGFTGLTQLFFDLAEHADDFMPVRDEVAPHVQRARAAGVSHVDVDVRLPRVCAETSVQFNDLLDCVERLSADAVLRTPAPLVTVTRFRRWYEAGTPPQRFPGEFGRGRTPPVKP